MQSSKIKDMKQMAYFDYFKSFSLNAFDTIKKLQTQFQSDIQDNIQFNQNLMFKRIRTLLSSYEILFIEIYDSCQFVEIPEFGNCIVKIFLQIMSIVKYLLKKIIMKSQTKDQQVKKQNRRSFNNRKDRKTTSFSSSPFQNQTITLVPSQFHRQKQQSRILYEDISNELTLFEQQHKQTLQASNQLQKSLKEGKQKLQLIQISENQSMISEMLQTSCRKNQSLNSFVMIRAMAMTSNIKDNLGECLKINDILDDDSNHKLENASTRLQTIFKDHVANFYKQKQSQMCTKDVQVNINPQFDTKTLQYTKTIKNLNQKIKKLNDQINYQQDKYRSLEGLFKKKNQLYELQIMNNRVQKIDDMKKLKIKNINRQSIVSHTKQKHKLCSKCKIKFNKQVSTIEDQNSTSKQQIQIQMEQNETKNQIEKQLIQQIPNTITRTIYKKRRKQTLTKAQLSFKITYNKSDSSELQSKIYEIKVDNVKKQSYIHQKSQQVIYQKYSQYKINSKEISIMKLYSICYNPLNESNLLTNNNELKKQGLSKKSFKSSKPAIIDKIYSQSNKQFQQKQRRINFDQSIDNFETNYQIQKFKKYARVQTQGNWSIQQQKQNYQIHRSQKQNKSNRKNTTINIHNKYLINDKSSQRNTEGSIKNNNFMFNSIIQKEPLKLLTQKQRLTYPKLMRLQPSKTIELTLRTLTLLFFEKQIAQNFQYVNLFQNQDQKTLPINGFKRNNTSMKINIENIQKQNKIKTFLNKIQPRNISSRQNLKTQYNLRIQYQNTNLKTQTQITILNKQINNEKEQLKLLNKDKQLQKLIKHYDLDALVAILLKQLKQFKRLFNCVDNYPNNLNKSTNNLNKSTSNLNKSTNNLNNNLNSNKNQTNKSNSSMNNYAKLRNFLRYPYSTITLSYDKTFLQTQKNDKDIEYLELRKILLRMLNLHKHCSLKNKINPIFQTLRIGQNAFPSNYNPVQQKNNESVVCGHIAEFFQLIGVILLPKN